jgi:hypothetical protein
MNLFGGLTAVAADDASALRGGMPWPRVGQEFELYIAAINDGTLTLLPIQPPVEVHNVLVELGISDMSELFGDNEAFIVGLWDCRIKFFLTYYTDWESGQREYDFGFEVLVKEKL